MRSRDFVLQVGSASQPREAVVTHTKSVKLKAGVGENRQKAIQSMIIIVVRLILHAFLWQTCETAPRHRPVE